MWERKDQTRAYFGNNFGNNVLFKRPEVKPISTIITDWNVALRSLTISMIGRNGQHKKAQLAGSGKYPGRPRPTVPM